MFRPYPTDQRGAALIIVLAVIVPLLLYALLDAFKAYSNQFGHSAAQRTELALIQARAALIGRASTDDNRPGSLPCPDTDHDGSAETFHSNHCPSYVGRLPWKTLGLTDLRDGSGERLWYVLSESFRDSKSAEPINSDTQGSLTVTGLLHSSRYAAIVIAPGRPLIGQQRDDAHLDQVSAYLEEENADGDTDYQSGGHYGAFNDRLLEITPQQIFIAVEKRVASEIRKRLLEYYTVHHFFPYANDYSDGNYAPTAGQTRGRIPTSLIAGGEPLNHWLFRNEWHLLSYYTLAPACADSTPDCSGTGWITVTGLPVPNDDKRALVFLGGRALSGQTRPCGSAADCLEGSENTNLDDVYAIPSLVDTSNDRLTLIAP